MHNLLRSGISSVIRKSLWMSRPQDLPNSKVKVGRSGGQGARRHPGKNLSKDYCITSRTAKIIGVSSLKDIRILTYKFDLNAMKLLLPH
jgi:hypothetical protein